MTGTDRVRPVHEHLVGDVTALLDHRRRTSGANTEEGKRRCRSRDGVTVERRVPRERY
jgi:hypothetical protein